MRLAGSFRRENKMQEKIRIALIGCGRFCRFFVPLFKAHPAVEQVYVCDERRQRAETYSKEFTVPVIESFEDALKNDRINAVGIFTQRTRHGSMVIQALKAGRNVYSAVPCSINIEEIMEIEELVRTTHLTYSMGETGFYRAATVFCRREYAKGTFGRFTYGEAHYNHDIRNMEQSFRSSGGEDWRRFAGVPPMYYPTHSTSMILSTMPGVHTEKVVAFGFENSPRTDIFGRNNVNHYNNPFANTTMLLKLSNGGIARISENRCIGWKAPETYISQFYGTDGGYEFSVARHHLAHWDPERPGFVTMKDVTEELQPELLTNMIRSDYDAAIQRIADGEGFREAAPIQPFDRLPEEFKGLENAHNGTHHFMVDDFCRAVQTGMLSPTNIWQAARFNIPGLLAHQSALRDGLTLNVPDLGDPPADWPVLDPVSGTASKLELLG